MNDTGHALIEIFVVGLLGGIFASVLQCSITLGKILAALKDKS